MQPTNIKPNEITPKINNVGKEIIKQLTDKPKATAENHKQHTINRTHLKTPIKN